MENEPTYTYLEAWEKGFQAGKEIELELLNKHCRTSFKTLTEAIHHIRELHSQIEMLGGEVEGVSPLIEDDEPSVQELDEKSKQELKKIDSLSIEYSCVIRKKEKFNLNLIDLNFKNGKLKITPTLIQLNTSKRIFPSSGSNELDIWKEKIFDASLNGRRVFFNVQGLGDYSLTFKNEAISNDVYEKLAGNTSEKAKKDELEIDGMLDVIFSINTTPWVTSFIIAVCVGIFGLMITKGYGLLTSDSYMAIKWGSKLPLLVADGEYWRLLSSGFLHFGFIHLALNMYILFQVGYFFERIYGSLYFLALYLFITVLSSLIGAWWHPLANSVGASGAIFGLFSATTIYAFLSKNKLPESISRQLIKDGLIFLFLNLALSFTFDFIDYGVHIGGMISGIIFGFIFGRPLTVERSNGFTLSSVLRICSASLIIFTSWYFLIAHNNSFQDKVNESRSSYFYSIGSYDYRNKDYESTLKNMHLASDLGNKLSPGMLGYMYEKALGAKKDLVKSSYWYGVGAERKDAIATFNLGLAYEYGDGVSIDKIHAYKLFKQAAEFGSNPAKLKTIHALMLGAFGTDRDEISALNYLQELALDKDGFQYIKDGSKDQYPGSQYALGKIYQMGYGVLKNEKLAFENFQAAAQKNFALAEYEVGMAYSKGLVVEADQLTAQNWFKRSVTHGYDLAASSIIISR